MITSEGMKRIFANVFGRRNDEAKVTKAPGRVNLIGEHTDYNDGFVLPTPISRHVWAAAATNESGTANLYAGDYDERASFDLDDIRFDVYHSWANYVMGVAWALLEEGHSLGGVDLAISGDVPVGAGLSSSAAIEVAVARMFVHLFGLEIDPVELAYIGKRAENEFVGVQSGIMDQFVGSLGRLGEALLGCHREHDGGAGAPVLGLQRAASAVRGRGPYVTERDTERPGTEGRFPGRATEVPGRPTRCDHEEVHPCGLREQSRARGR